MIFVSGQMKRKTLVPVFGSMRQLGDQEVNTIKLVDSLTKWAIRLDPPYEDINHGIQKALYEAVSERPGPVWLDVPLDVQAMDVDPNLMTTFVRSPHYWMLHLITLSAITDRIRKAERPVIIAGHGICLAHAEDKLYRLVEGTHIPMVPSFNSLDLEFPRKFGPFGTIGTNAANTLVQEADLVLILGCRMNIRQIGYEFGKLAKNAYKIMVDIDEEELAKKTFVPDEKIHCGVAEFLDTVLQEGFLSVYTAPASWIAHCDEVARLDAAQMPIYPDRANFVNPYRVIQSLNRVLQPHDIIVSSNGMASIVASQMLKTTQGMRFLVNSGAGAMGYGLPMSIGACRAAGERRVVCLEGDGSLQMNIQELETLVYNNLPVKLIVFNNRGYNSIRNTAEAYFEGRVVGADPSSGVGFPDLRRIAKAYGIEFRRVFDNVGLKSSMQWLMCGNYPKILEAMTDPDSKPMPKGVQYA